MTISVIVMIVIGIIICLASFFISEKISNKEESLHNLMSVDDDYEFSDRELRIIRRKIEDVIANQAKDILYETNESLSNMANEKTMALGDYAVAVCEQIEKNHKEVMFLYSMLDDKQKDIMKTVRIVNDANKEAKDVLDKVKNTKVERVDSGLYNNRQSAIEQLTALAHKKIELNNADLQQNVSEPQTKIKKEASLEYMPKEEVATMEEVDSESDADLMVEDYNDFEDSTGTDLVEVEDVFAELDQTDIDFDEVLEEEFTENENSNDIILQMHRNGSSIIDIAKELGLGVGEVKLVIDLYQKQ